MTLTVELDPELELRLRREAAICGLEPAQYVRRFLADGLPPQNEQTRGALWDTLSPVEWVAALRAFSASHSAETPVLSEKAMSRESIYGTRGA